jgi:hypothetical protein
MSVYLSLSLSLSISPSCARAHPLSLSLSLCCALGVARARARSLALSHRRCSIALSHWLWRSLVLSRAGHDPVHRKSVRVAFLVELLLLLLSTLFQQKV